jgi:hypothetical protein
MRSGVYRRAPKFLCRARLAGGFVFPSTAL